MDMWLDLADSHLDLGTYMPGLFAWYITNPVPFDEPIPYQGKTRLFRVDTNGNNARILEEKSKVFFPVSS